ncbi:MAG: phage scaffolding protein [Oscillospiraceae bacterium]|nr:phage scaffolding protein [Oscillospiraceae bacterium]
MDKLFNLLKKLGFELTADQTAQVKEVLGREFVAAEDAAKKNTELEELRKQLEQRNTDLEKLKSDTTSAELKKQLDELNAKYKTDTENLTAKLTAQETDFAAERLLGGYKFANERVKKSVLEEFKGKGFKYENGAFVGGKEFLEELKKKEPDVFAKEQQGLFMGSTQSGVSVDSNNLEAQINSGFGFDSK